MLHDKITLAIVDDHPVVIEGIKSLLKQDPLLGMPLSFTSGTDFLGFLKTNEVQLVLLDIMLPDMNGLELCREIKKISPDTFVLALSNQEERSIILQALQNGASGYVLKNASSEELIRCIQDVLNGEIAFSKDVKEIMAKPSRISLKDIPTITKREREILQLLAEGKTTAVMADQLKLSPLTVETHRRNLLQKFGVNNAAELVMAAVQQKLL
jgi:DNA-binding NarL/FixJ family response regulator